MECQKIAANLETWGSKLALREKKINKNIPEKNFMSRIKSKIVDSVSCAFLENGYLHNVIQ